MEKLKIYLEAHKLITDGAFGTYYSRVYDTNELPESVNITMGRRVTDIHKQYINAGAKLIRTNTFAANTVNLECNFDEVKANIKAAVANARQAVKECGREVYIAADIGPIPNDNLFDKQTVVDEYVDIAKVFLEEGINVFVFETFADLSNISDAIDYIGSAATGGINIADSVLTDRPFVITQFAINQFGYSNCGLSSSKLVKLADDNPYIDALGFNCGIGPGHMEQFILKERRHTDKYLSALPNAGYPQAVSGRMIFSDKNMDYYSDKMCELLNAGADIIGGCCGTTPDYIDRIASKADFTQNRQGEGCDWETDNSVQAVNTAFYHNKEGKKLIAVELAPPFDSNADKLLDAAHYLKSKGVDVLTFPDSPSGRTRADSILMAEKVSRQTEMCVMPHLCCRDKNAIAIRSQILGADINGINNFLVITGDPIPSVMRSSVKSVFNFDSVGFMNILDDMNSEQFADQPVTYGGAINQGRKRLDIEIGRVKKKMEAGATFFMTQPAFCDEDIERIATIKKETGARILCGIMPLVSFKNASFMKNEMTGINVTDEVLLRYRPDMTKEEGEQAGIDLAVEIINKSIDIVDGYYFSFPFIRVHMLDKIIKQSELYVNN